MRRLLILAAIALATSSCARNPAQGSVDSKTHKMCLQAKDYLGCVQAQNGINTKSNKEKINESKYTSEKIHIARCGFDLEDCEIVFNDGEMIINEVFRISRRQFEGVVKSTECRQRSIALPILKSCFHSQYDRDFTIAYKDLNGLSNSTRVSFRPGYSADQSGWRNFQFDLQSWAGMAVTPLSIDRQSKKIPMACKNGVWDEDHPKCQVPEETILSPINMD